MINELTILLILLCVSLLIIAVIYFRSADYYLSLYAQARAYAQQQAASFVLLERRVHLHAKAVEQCTDRIGLLVAHNNELLAENEALHNRVLYLNGLVNCLDSLAIARLAEMDRPLMWLPSDRRKDEPSTINLN